MKNKLVLTTQEKEELDDAVCGVRNMVSDIIAREGQDADYLNLMTAAFAYAAGRLWESRIPYSIAYSAVREEVCEQMRKAQLM